MLHCGLMALMPAQSTVSGAGLAGPPPWGGVSYRSFCARARKENLPNSRPETRALRYIARSNQERQGERATSDSRGVQAAVDGRLIDEAEKRLKLWFVQFSLPHSLR